MSWGRMRRAVCAVCTQFQFLVCTNTERRKFICCALKHVSDRVQIDEFTEMDGWMGGLMWCNRDEEKKQCSGTLFGSVGNPHDEGNSGAVMAKHHVQIQVVHWTVQFEVMSCCFHSLPVLFSSQ